MSASGHRAFNYRALAPDGRQVRGVIEADSPRHVRTLLRGRSLRPVEVAASHNAASGSGGARRRLAYREQALLTRQLATLLRAGMPVAEALAAAAQQSRRDSTRALILQVRSRVVEGHTLAYALGEFPRTFGSMYRAMVRAGESAGYLGNVLERLAEHIDSHQRSRQKLQMAMIYPLILMAVAMAVIALLMIFVVPRLVGVFVYSKQSLPLLTRALMAVSEFLVTWYWAIALGVAAMVLGARRLLQRPAVRRRWHRLLLKTPLLGTLLIGMETGRFAATLGMLTASGVPLLGGLRIATEVVANTALRTAAERVAGAVEEGGSLHRALEAAGIFPPLLVHMVASGEASGSLAEMLARAADSQERELDLALGAALALFEPAMLVTMAAVVGLIVLAILQPIIQMNSLVM